MQSIAFYDMHHLPLEMQQLSEQHGETYVGRK